MTEPPEGKTQGEVELPDVVDAAERLPSEIEAADLRKYFSLTMADCEQVERCRGPANKLGFSVQLCALRWRGHFLPDTRDVPAAVLQVLAPQLGLLPILIAEYPQDEKTRFVHLERIRRHLGFVRCDHTQRQRLLAHLTAVAPQRAANRSAAQGRTSIIWNLGGRASRECADQRVSDAQRPSVREALTVLKERRAARDIPVIVVIT